MALGNQDNTVSFRSISDKLDQIAAAYRRHWVAEHALVDTLFYDTLSVRQGSIPEAHKETFHWIFLENGTANGSGTDSSTKPTILDWLLNGEGIYWVSGKPGSGKSTLMKFMASNRHVRAALDRWSGTKKCVISAYYFWNAGTELQKSVEGLLRSLLFDIFARNPELVPIAVPERWEAVRDEAHSRRYQITGSAIVHSWTVLEMLDALARLSSAQVRIRFFLFIDGLDEYHGDHLHLLKIIETLGRSQNFKLCVSSRPWNVFEDALGLDPQRKLYIHELTRRDIQRYISSTLAENKHWRTESPRDTRYQALTDDITDRAQGVFLWVALVVRSVQEGLTNGDSIQMLQQRTRELPNELGPFFRHILTSIPEIYHTQMALYFRVALQASKPPTLMLYSFLDDHFEFSINQPSVVPPHFISSMRPVGGNSINEEEEEDSDFSRILSLTQRRLNARTKGLLESYTNYSGPAGELCLAQEVTFLHRTVRDFLSTSEMGKFLEGILVGYPINTVVLGAFVELFEKVPGARLARNINLVEEAMFCGGKAEEEEGEFPELAVEYVTKICCAVPYLTMGDKRSPTMMDLIFRNGLVEYVKLHTGIRSEGFQDPSDMLRLALRPRKKKIDGGTPGRVRVARALLEAGARADDGMWADYAERLWLLARKPNEDGSGVAEELEMFQLILSHTKDINVTGEDGNVVWANLFTVVVGQLVLSPTKLLTGWLKLLQILFAHGIDPNAPYQLGTIWSWFSLHVRKQYPKSACIDTKHLQIMATITQNLLRAGADLSHRHTMTVADVGCIFPPHLAEGIVEVMEEQRRYLPTPSTMTWISWIGSWIWSPATSLPKVPADAPGHLNLP